MGQISNCRCLPFSSFLGWLKHRRSQNFVFCSARSRDATCPLSGGRGLFCLAIFLVRGYTRYMIQKADHCFIVRALSRFFASYFRVGFRRCCGFPTGLIQFGIGISYGALLVLDGISDVILLAGQGNLHWFRDCFVV